VELEFTNLSMMDLRSSPGDILDRVYKNGEAFIIERNGQPKACLVPIYLFCPDIPKDKVNNELEDLRRAGESPILRISEKKELEIIFKEKNADFEVTLKIVLPHGYPNVAPKVFASPISTKAPHRWQDGALCLFGTTIGWNPGTHNIAFVLKSARKWLSCYREWSEKGSWPVERKDDNE